MYLTKTTGNLNPRGQQPQSNLQVSTVRSFEGGLNVTDTDLNLSPKYARVLDNMERGTDGTLSIRPGTVLVTDNIMDPTNIINHVYFGGLVWSVQASGNITATDGQGNVTVRHRMPGDVVPWPTGITFVDFTVFNSDLIIVNGRDKPLIVPGRPSDPNYLVVGYLQDLASLSNVNTPIGRFVIAHGRYTIISGVPTDPSCIFVSAIDTSGTYVGDPAPNDGIKLDLGTRVSLGSSTITGMVAYRDKLIVTFERGVLPVNLGVYTGTPSVHTPTDDGFIEEFGCLSHRSLISVGDDTFFNDNIGVNSITRINIFNTLRPVRVSHLIDPLITDTIQKLTQEQIDLHVFAVLDIRNHRYMLFVPVYENNIIVETICFSYTNIPAFKVEAWARLRGWIWQSACRTSLQNIIFSRGNKLYAYDFDSDLNADRRNDPIINGGAGEPIAFEWELPWADFKHRMDIKLTRYLSFDTQGQAAFTCELYIDNKVRDINGNRVPMLSFPFVGGDAIDGRLTSEERLYAFTTKFKLMKLRMFGSSDKPLRFVSVSIAYIHGSIRR